jgi:hypothetical protein
MQFGEPYLRGKIVSRSELQWTRSELYFTALEIARAISNQKKMVRAISMCYMLAAIFFVHLYFACELYVRFVRLICFKEVSPSYFVNKLDLQPSQPDFMFSQMHILVLIISHKIIVEGSCTTSLCNKS